MDSCLLYRSSYLGIVPEMVRTPNGRRKMAKSDTALMERVAAYAQPSIYARNMVDFGCDYCADDQNRWFGHVAQIASDEKREMILIRCPRCGTLYENTPSGEDRSRRLTEDEAEALFPDFRR